MVQYITDYQYYCPNTKQVLLGYSAGGIITMNVGLPTINHFGVHANAPSQTLCGASPPPWAPTAPLDFGRFGRNRKPLTLR